MRRKQSLFKFILYRFFFPIVSFLAATIGGIIFFFTRDIGGGWVFSLFSTTFIIFISNSIRYKKVDVTYNGLTINKIFYEWDKIQSFRQTFFLKTILVTLKDMPQKVIMDNELAYKEILNWSTKDTAFVKRLKENIKQKN